MAELVSNEYQSVESGRKEFLASVKRLGYDGSDAWKQAVKPAAEVKQQPAKKAAKKSILGAAAKKRIAEAQRKRWAAAKKKGGRK